MNILNIYDNVNEIVYILLWSTHKYTNINSAVLSEENDQLSNFAFYEEFIWFVRTMASDLARKNANNSCRISVYKSGLILSQQEYNLCLQASS